MLLKRKYLILAFTLGICLIIAGFFYDVIYAGIPFQDPTIAMQKEYLRQQTIAYTIMKSGLAVSLLSIILSLTSVFFKRILAFKSTQ